MSSSPFASGLAYASESAQGTPPADSSAWASNGTRVRFIGNMDLSDIKQTMVPDERNADLIQGGSDIQMQKGTRNGSKAFTLALCGSEATTSDTNQVATTEIGGVLSHCLGNVSRTYATTAATSGSHTGTAVELTATTGYDEGTYLNHIDSNGDSNLRKIADLTGAVATVDQAFSETPSDGDKIAPVLCYYIDESILCDSNGGGGPYTYSWHCRSGDHDMVLKGAVATLTSIETGLNAAAQFGIEVLYADFDDPTVAPTVTWGANAEGGLAGIPIGPKTQCFLQDKGTTTAASVSVQDVSLDPGVPRVAEPAVTSLDDNMEGTARYGMGRGDTMLSVNVLPAADAHFTDFNAGTAKVCRISTRNAEGSNMGFELSNAEITETPSPANTESMHATPLVLKGHPDTANSAAANAALWRSKLKIFQF